MTDDLERRLRGALTARAGQITQNDLRLPEPPTMSARARAFPILLRVVLLATALVLVAAVLLPSARPGPAPQQPASTPSWPTGSVCPPYAVEEGESPPGPACPAIVSGAPSTDGG